MDDAPLHYRDVSDITRMLRQRKISAIELSDHLLARIARIEPALRSFAYLDADHVRQQARAADDAIARGESGPLLGVPIGVKDLFWTNDMPTAAGMPIHRDFRPSEDATVVRRLRDAGAVIVGKLQMTEGAFALHHPSIEPPLNPWDPALWPGASSSGSGVAVAAGLCFAALGSDTGGSIRFPCAANGLTGLKPGWGTVSRHGAFELAASLDHVGPIARSARDAALILSVIGGRDPADPTSRPGEPGLMDWPDPARLVGLRIGFDPRWTVEGCDADTAAGLAEAMDDLRALGATLHGLTLPDVGPVVADWELLAGVEAAIAHADSYPLHGDQYGPALARLIETGRRASASDHQRALLRRMALRGALDAVLADVDILIAPVQPYAAPTLERLGELASDPVANARLIGFTAPFNLGGQPAISLPCRPTSRGEPVGFQLVAGHGHEQKLLRAATAFQRQTSWHRLHPEIEPAIPAARRA